MPEEINRILTDSISDLLLTPSPDGDENLKAEGIPPDKIKFVGNVMIDSLFYSLKIAENSNVRENLGLTEKNYAVLTLHPPSNVNEMKTFSDLLDAIIEIGKKIPAVFPRIREHGRISSDSVLPKK